LLRWAVSHQLKERLVLGIELVCTLQIRTKGGLVAGHEEAALRVFHVNQQLEQMPGLVENPIGVINPP
jgi:hypothetical protein